MRQLHRFCFEARFLGMLDNEEAMELKKRCAPSHQVELDS